MRRIPTNLRATFLACGASAVLAVMAAVAMTGRSLPPRAGILEFAPAEIDLTESGVSVAGKKITQAIQLRNRTGRPLTIEELSSSCSCAPIRLSDGRSLPVSCPSGGELECVVEIEAPSVPGTLRFEFTGIGHSDKGEAFSATAAVLVGAVERPSDIAAEMGTRTDSHAVPLKIGSGVLHASEIEHDFGEILPNQKLSHSFTFTNVGDAPLVFRKATTSCDCTTTSPVEDVVLQPGQETNVTVTVASRNEPLLRQFVFLDLIEPESNAARQLTLSLLGTQRFFKSVAPRQLDFGVVVPGRSYSRSLRVTESSVDRYAIRGVDSGSLPLTWSVTESRNAHDLRVYALDFTLDVPDEWTPQPQHVARPHLIHLLTDSDASAEIPVPVSFEVAPWLFVVPVAIALGEVPVGDERRCVVRITAADGAPLEADVKSLPTEAAVEVTNGSNTVELNVRITLSHAGVWHGRIVADVRTGLREESLEIKCVAIGKPL